MFSVSATGTLRPVRGSPFPTAKDLDTRSIAFAPGGRLLAVAVNRVVAGRRSIRPSVSGVAVFSVSRSGTLRRVRGSPFSNGRKRVAEALAFSPDGKLLAVANSTGRVSLFSVARSGALEPGGGSPFATGSGHAAAAIAFSPGGGLLATGNDDGTVSVLSLNPRTRGLEPVPGSPYPGGATSLAFSPDGRLLATAWGGLSLFSVDRATGALSPLSTPTLSGFTPAGVAFSPSGSVLAVPSSDSGGVALFSVSPGGSLSQLPGLAWMPNSLFSTGADTPGVGAAFDGSGRLLALPERGGGVSVLTIH
jgi:WD40 repeat protein